jgi:hypothetical protein
MTTSPPSHISLSKRDSYGFGADLATTSAEDNGDDDQDVMEAFAQEETQAEDTVIPTKFTNGSRGEHQLEFNRGLIPDSSYGAHLRLSTEGDRQDRHEEDGKDELTGKTSGSADRPKDRIPGTAAFDSPNPSEVGSGAGTPYSLEGSGQPGKTHVDDDFGDFIQGGQVRFTVLQRSSVRTEMANPEPRSHYPMRHPTDSECPLLVLLLQPENQSKMDRT